MNITNLKKTADEILGLAGIEINGNNPWDIKVYNKEFYKRVLSGSSLALGESYIDGWWDCERLDEFFNKILRAQIDKKVKRNFKLILKNLSAIIFNFQIESRAFNIGKKHYDIGNDLYKYMLDARMVYSCAYWRNAKTLDKAQEAKLDLICKKIELKPGMKILDIGCGWGSFAKYAAEKYKVKVVGITISNEQAKLARELCKGLPVEIRLQDYRKLNEKFDHIISVGMFEHVGYKNYRTYIEVVHRCLKPDGLFLLHTIGGRKSVNSTDPWINKYIFPDSMLPSAKQISAATEGLFVLEDWENFGAYYDNTLIAWYNNFNKNWNKLKSNYNERFYKMWKYYLLSCAGTFRSRKNQLWQMVFSKNGVLGGYKSVR